MKPVPTTAAARSGVAAALFLVLGVTAAAAAAAAALPVPAAAAARSAGAVPQGDQAAIDAYYKSLPKRFEAKDVAGIAKLLAEDFAETDIYGVKHTRAEWKGRMEGLFGGAKDFRVTLTAREPVVSGDRTTVLTGAQVTFRTADAPADSPPLRYESLSRDEWTRTPAGMRLRSTLRLREAMTREGKPFYPGESAETAALRAELKARYAEWDRALAANDMAAFAKLLPDDFKSTDTGGKASDRDAFVRSVGGALADAKDARFTSDVLGILPVGAAGDRAVVIHRLAFSLAFGADGESVPYKAEFIFRETYAKIKDRWTLRTSEDVMQEGTAGDMPFLDIAEG